MGGRIGEDSRQASTPVRGAASATPRAPGNNLGATPGSPAPEPPAADNDGGAGQAEPTPQSGSKLKRGGISQTDHNNETGPLSRALPALPLPSQFCLPGPDTQPSSLIHLSWDLAGGSLGDLGYRWAVVPSWPRHRMLGLLLSLMCHTDIGFQEGHWAQCPGEKGRVRSCFWCSNLKPL